jgi:hypothetical protein
MVLPAKKTVGKEREPGLLLHGDEFAEVAFELPLDGVLRRAPAIEVPRRLYERVGTRIDPGRICLQLQAASP